MGDFMVNLEHCVSKAIRDVMDYQTPEDLIKNTKRIYLRQINTMYSGASIIENLTGNYNVSFDEEGSDWVADLAEKLTLGEIYFHYTHILTCKINTYLFKFEITSGLTDKYKENIQSKNLFSDYGQPIWAGDLPCQPKLWLCHKDDEDLNHVSLIFISKGDYVRYYDIVSHKVQKIYKTGLINCRMHLDDGILAMAVRDFPFDETNDILSFLNKNFGLNPLEPIEITDQDIRNFDGHPSVISTSHEKREGQETTTALTRNTENGDTRNDPLRGNIDDREFRLEHGVIDFRGENLTVKVKKGRCGSIQFSRYLNPEEHNQAIHRMK